MDKHRIKRMTVKTTPKVKSRRKKIRTIRKGYIDNKKESEKAELYVSGGFS